MLEKFRGALIGFAIGDALGMPAEGLSYDEIKRLFGKIEDFLDSPLGDLKAGEWTDDTEQMLTLAESLIDRKYLDPLDLSRRLIRMRSKRLGWTTKRALERLKMGYDWLNSGVESESCGACLRVLPIGLVFSFDLNIVENYAFISAILTHRGPSAIGAVAYAIMISCILRSESLNNVIKTVEKYDETLAEKIGIAKELAGEELDRVIDEIGNSNSVFECLPLAINIFISSKDFRECAEMSANSGGDTDSISAMACGLKGCELGIDRIPRSWVYRLKDHKRILDISDKLYDLHLILRS